MSVCVLHNFCSHSNSITNLLNCIKCHSLTLFKLALTKFLCNISDAVMLCFHNFSVYMELHQMAYENVAGYPDSQNIRTTSMLLKTYKYISVLIYNNLIRQQY